MKIITDPSLYREKEDLYIKVRDAEGWIVDDELLKLLPAPPVSDVHAFEWRIRHDRMRRFMRYLSKKFNGKPLRILDIGCGNGWMSHKLFMAGHILTCVDLNMTELQQAERVFGEHSRLQWMYANVLDDEIPNEPFHLILLAASCQYFPDLDMLTRRSKLMLVPGGEVHLLDSMFYSNSEVYAAKARTVDYYQQLGVPEMAKHYFHHTRAQVAAAGYRKHRPMLFAFKKQLEWWIYRMG